MPYTEENDVYNIQTYDLTKRFAKKKHRGIFGFLRKEHKKESQKSEHVDVTVALDHVNIKIRSGELFGLLGPNGAGKTTLVKCLSTILIPDEGTALVNGFDVRKQTSMVRASLGLVIGGERIEELLEVMQLSDRADERLEDYSTGMRQKIAVARALLHDPPILLLDEPTLGLDPTFSRQIRDMIRALSEKQKKTVLLTTHYMEEADQLCDRIAIINDGRVIAVDTADNLKAMVKETQLVEIACYNPPPDIKVDLRALCPDVEIVDLIDGDEAKGAASRIKLIGGNAEERISSVMDLLRHKNVRICSLNISVPTLEDVFIKLTGASFAPNGHTR